MASDLQKYNIDRQSTFQGGANTAFDPDLIEPNQLAWSKNIDLRGGKIRTRGGFVERTLLPFGRVQGIDYFTVNNGRIMLSISGKLYEIDLGLEEFVVSELNLPTVRNDETEQVFMQETSGFMVIQDGEATPMIYDGSTVRLAESNEVPVGQHMAYGNGRLWVNTGKGRVEAGDIAGTDINGGSELKFTENIYLLGGGYFAMPGDVLGMSFMPSNDGTTGYGPLLIFGRDYSIALRADIAQRNEWSNVEGFQSVIFPQIGTTGHFSIVRANSDLLWRDHRGDIREVRQASADYENAGSTPLSREASRITDRESEDILLFAHSIYHDSRMFAAASPYFVYQNQVGSKDLLVQDFSPLGSRGQKAPPIFNGEWEGMTVTHAVNIRHEGKDRAFFVSKDATGNNRLWEYREEERFDISLDGISDPLEEFDVTSITSSGTTATATTSEDNTYSVGNIVTVSSDEETFSGVQEITAKPAPNQFEYTIEDFGNQPDPSTGITVAKGGPIPVKNKIRSEIEFRKTALGSPDMKKVLRRFDVFVSEVEDVEATIYYRADHDPQWYKWDSWQFCTKVTDGSTADPHVFQELSEGQHPQVKPFTSQNEGASMVGYEFQIKMIIDGHIKIDKVATYAEVLPNQDVYANESRRPSNPECVNKPVTPVELHYEIPVYNIINGNYVDQNGDSYVDEIGDDYGG